MMKYVWLIILLFSLFSRVRNDLESRDQKPALEAVAETTENGKINFKMRDIDRGASIVITMAPKFTQNLILIYSFFSLTPLINCFFYQPPQAGLSK